jgi:hypothetical protein
MKWIDGDIAPIDLFQVEASNVGQAVEQVKTGKAMLLQRTSHL